MTPGRRHSLRACDRASCRASLRLCVSLASITLSLPGDCHGLPVEREIDKALGITSQDDGPSRQLHGSESRSDEARHRQVQRCVSVDRLRAANGPRARADGRSATRPNGGAPSSAWADGSTLTTTTRCAVSLDWRADRGRRSIPNCALPPRVLTDRRSMESVWWVFSQLFSKSQVYKGQRVMRASARR